MPPPYDTNTTCEELVADYAETIRGKIILTTGVTPGGIGAAFVEAVAKAKPAVLILAGRNAEKNQKEADKVAKIESGVTIKTLTLDLGSLAAVRKAADEVNSWSDVPHVDVLMNNAGLMARPYELTVDGFESQFGTNHLGHFLFTNLIMGKVLKAEAPRVICVTSDGHRLNPMRWADINFDGGETYNKWQAYGQSKTANMLMAMSLAKKLGPKLQSYSLHPGVVEGTALGAHCDWEVDIAELNATDKSLGNPEGWASLNYKNQSRGTATSVYSAFDPNLMPHNGAYLLDSRVGDPLKDTIRPWATSMVEADRLWTLSEELVKQKFEY